MAKKKIAVILAGAVAKGAFEAGVLDVLAEKIPDDVEIVRVVGASSGSLNATMLASGIHTGKPHEATKALTELWQKEGGILNAFHFNLGDVVAGRGLSDQKHLRRLLEEHIQPTHGQHQVELKIILAPLAGNRGTSGMPSVGSTYEAVLGFSQADFESKEGLDAVFDAAVASSAFPVLFAPSDPGSDLGPCIDGGVVNNTPIKYAIGGDVNTVVMIAPTVAEVSPGQFKDAHGLDLLGHVSDMLINERLHRDLVTAHQVNEALSALDALVATGQLSSTQLDKVKEALDWSRHKLLEIVPIRPTEPLPGNSFSAFFRPGLRKQYIEAGRERATEVLGALGW